MKRIISLCIAAQIITASATAQDKYPDNNYSSISNNIELFGSVIKELNMNYVDTINNNKTVEVAIQAMLNEIDPYTEYFPPREQEDFMIISTGEYGGMGALISKDKAGNIIVSQPYYDSPSQKAGLKAGDIFLTIDGDTVDNKWTVEKASSKLKGTMNTTLKLTVKRPYTTGDSILHFTITRDKIKLNPVPYYGVVKDNVGYIQINSFNEKTGAQVKDALVELKKNKAVTSIVLDLRGNGGGLLDEAVKVVGLFVAKGTEVLKTRGRLKQSEKSYKTTQDPIDTKIPLAVLIDESSASASEITAGALQDLDRAVIIGNRSFGKGLVQSTRPVGEGLLKVTIAKYYIPSGRLIQAIDYSHRNAAGEATRMPDSLTTVFHTAAGREVRDGGGISPDVTVEYDKLNRLVYNIVRDNWAFDFATKYAATHETIAPVEEFTINDEIYSDFVEFIDPAKFNYDKVCETLLSQLKKTAKDEGYLNDSTEIEFSRMESLLKHDLKHDLMQNRKAISEIIASEIVKRYYYERGSVIEFLKHDPGIEKVAEVMQKKARVKELLTPQPK